MEKNKIGDILKFLICSITGVILFLVPISVNGVKDLPIAIVADGITAIIKPVLPLFLSVVFSLASVISIICLIKPVKFVENSWILKESFTDLTLSKVIFRVLGAAFFVMCSFGGPEFVTSSATGGTMYDLVVKLFAWHVISFYLFCFLMDFGAMDFVGTLVTKIMRPLFTLPGNSAVDCAASWVGNGPFGVMITKMQYDEGYYTMRESAVVASCFSIVSISFCTVVAKTLDIMPYYGSYYLSLSITTVICAVVLPRIWPLNKIADTYKPGAPDRYDVVEEGSLLVRAINCGADKAKEANVVHLLKRSTQTAVDFILTVFPTMMAYGTILLIVTEYTPLIQIIATPFTWLLSLLNIPEAAAAGPAMIVGFIDMYLPAIAGAGITSEMTRFVIGSVSISQLIYMTETGAVIIKNKSTFGLSLWQLAVLFVFRTIIAIPIAIIFAKIVF